jgi:hypothetical protein
MPIRVTNLRLGLDEPLDALPAQLGRVLGVRPDGLEWRLLRKSLDTRDKHDIHFVYNAEVRLPEDEPAAVRNAQAHPRGAKVELFAEPPFVLPEPGPKPLPHRPVVIGSGRAGGRVHSGRAGLRPAGAGARQGGQRTHP